MKHYFLIASLVLLSWTGVAHSQTNLKIGIVDVQHVLTQSKAGKKAKSNIESYVKKKKKELNKEEKVLDKLQKEFEKNKLTMTKDQVRKKQAQFQKKLTAYKKKAAMSSQEVEKRKRKYQSRALKELKKIVDEIAAKDGYQMLLEKNETGLLFAEESMDITEKVMKIFNKRVK